ncbi:hypothetical protein D9615_010583 [Tricholomella constricta]|uniref:CCHC-type domain-containing protein n=1 Tax=Tricholomella constricta TaxID=117010 RepID=A0A8H5GM52_9AGAR|nr:hypothetical protein D9615_010583 [Tricholomella constricta]
MDTFPTLSDPRGSGYGHELGQPTSGCRVVGIGVGRAQGEMGNDRNPGPAPPTAPPAASNPSATEQHTRLQQRLLRGARTILVEANPDDDLAPTDRSPAGSYAVRLAMNKQLEELDRALEGNFYITEEGESAPAESQTYIRGLAALDRGAYLFEMSTADAACRFREYATDPTLAFLKSHLGASARIKAKAYNLLFRFVPCGAFFDPSDRDHLNVIEDDNDLPSGAILSASWLKRPDRRSPKQTVASLKVVCSTAEAANRLLQERIFVAGHLVVIRKDLKEPIRCNKCQRYGHIRASCKSPERCATCASPDHVTTECPPNPTPRCPIFKKQCDDLESRLPENHMPYFPTGEAWTWAAAPPKLSKETPVHRPRVDHAPPAPPQIPKAPPRPVRQGTLDHPYPFPMNRRTPKAPGKLRIWQQNVRKSDLAQAAVLNTARPEDWDVIALQEPFLDRLGNTKASPFWTVRYPHHHRRDGSTRSRSILLINSNIATDSYTLLDIPSTDITAVRFNGAHGHLSIINVYNDCTQNDSLTTLSNYLSSSLPQARPSPRDHMLWLGDFNRHHPLWESADNRHLNSSEPAIRPLLDLLRDYEMELALPPTIHTLQTAGDRWTRPDNVWRSHNPIDPIVSCNVDAGLRPPITDHLPIVTVIELPIARSSSPPSRDFHTVDWKTFSEALETTLNLRSPARHISSLEEFDAKVTLLTSIIQETIAADDLVPMKKPCPFSKRWWCPELDEFKRPRSHASNEMYKYRDIADHPSKAEFKRLSRAMSDKIEEKRREHWIEWLENIDARQIYTANKVPDLRTKVDGIPKMATTNDEKAEALAESFFPPPPPSPSTPASAYPKPLPGIKYFTRARVVFDPKLRWSAHYQKVIASSTWWSFQVARLSKISGGMPPHRIRQLYNTVAVPAFTYAADIWYTGVQNPPGSKKRTGSVAVTKKLVPVQRRAAKLVTGSLSTTAGDVLDAHTNLLPVDLLYHKILQRAAARLASLPPSHPLHSPVRKAARRQVKRHRSPLHNLFFLTGIDPTQIETIAPTRRRPNYVPSFSTHIKGDKAKALAEANHIHRIAPTSVHCDGSGYEGGVGASAVLFVNGIEKASLKYHLGPITKHTVYEAEIVGLTLGLHLLTSTSRQLHSITAIGSDSQATIKALGNQKPHPAHYLLDHVHTAAEKLHVGDG